MFKKFLHDETTIIGLKSLGLSRNKNIEQTQKNNLNQNLQNTKTITNKKQINNKNTLYLNLSKSTKTVEGLFGREIKLNLHK